MSNRFSSRLLNVCVFVRAIPPKTLDQTVSRGFLPVLLDWRQMSPARHVLLFAAVLLCSGIGRGVQFSRDVCESQCTTASDFIENIPVEGPVDDADNRPYTWSIVAQLQIMFNLDVITPPGAGRACGLTGTCLFEAAALTTERKDPLRWTLSRYLHRIPLDDGQPVHVAMERRRGFGDQYNGRRRILGCQGTLRGLR